ncbi:MAG TPA: hypothetical protein VJ780_04745 [Flavobacterium sp.]|nr:hypothetical protein [Flavobacterium sp.]
MKKATIKYVLKMKIPKIILWCYLIWYFSIMCLYFESSLRLWASSLGISLIIGFALNLSTYQQGGNQDIWGRIRLFLFPFCVSSYSATIKDHDFILLFPNNTEHFFIALLNCLLFVSLIWVVKRVYKINNKRKYETLNPDY